MKWLSIALALIALAFAGTTIYFARELRLERASHAATTDAPAIMSAKTAAAQSAPVPVPAPDPADAVSPDFVYSVTATQRGQGSGPSEEEQKQAAIAQARKFLAELSDPVARARLLEQHRAMIKSHSQGLADYLHMDTDQFTRFIDLVAQQHLAHRETATRCMLDERCRYRGIGQDIVDANNVEIDAAFGAGTAERNQFFQLSSNERKAVAELRGRLPDNSRLSDAKAEELVQAWVDETSLIQADMRRVGYGIGTSNSMVYVVMDADPDGRRAAAASEYNQRWRERAAAVLTAEQLAIYTKLQDEALEQHRSFEELRQASN